MKKFTLLLFAVMLAVGAVAQDATIYKASVAPVIDGEVDEVWAEAEAEINIVTPYLDNVATLGDPGETTWQALWTDEGIYVLLRVGDDGFYPHYIDGVNSWEYDKPEIYFDVNYELEDAVGPSTANSGHYQVAPAFEDGSNDGTLRTCGFNGTEGDFIEFAFMVEDPSYIAEYFIPFENLVDKDGVGIDKTADMGFDVTIIDREPGDDAANSVTWMNNGANGSSWVNMDDCGVVVFDGAEAGIYISSITLSGDTEIDENNGTLNLEAVILPEDASNKKLIWSVENGTGRASVDANGVVTGIVDGDVTVTALASDGSYVETSTVITVSNQIVTRPELNLIRNGYFDDLKADNTPKEWNISEDTYVNDEGVCVIDPVVSVTTPPNVWDVRLQQQGGWGLNVDDMYEFSFVMWSDEADTFNVDFEDGRDAVSYQRLGDSNHEYAAGLSDWTFQSTTEPVKYIFDVQFTHLIVGESNEQFQFMLGKHDPVVYIDSVELVNENDLALLTADYIPVEMITISGDSKVVINETLQLTAAVDPTDATLTGVNWKVVPGTGWASIDESGLLTGDTAGSVVVVAMARDDSKVLASLDVSVTYPVGMEQRKVNTLNVYPNPAVNELNIVLTQDHNRVAIYNAAGMVMDELLVNGMEYTLDISNYASGVYFVKSGKLVTKFVK